MPGSLRKARLQWAIHIVLLHFLLNSYICIALIYIYNNVKMVNSR